MFRHNTQVVKKVNTWVVCQANTKVLACEPMKKMTYGERLRAARKHKKLSQTELANKSGVGQGSISKIERGDQESSAYDVELAFALDVNPLWLKNGNNEFMPRWLAITATIPGLQGPVEIESNASHAPTLGEFSAVPVVGIAQLGDNGHWSELEYPVGHGDGHINYPTHDRNAYALRCRGDSMKPRIRDGEFVVVEPNSEAIPGDEILLKTKDGRVMVKTFLYRRDGKVHVMSVNEAHPPQAFDLVDIDKIHPVAAIVKKALWVKGD